MAERNATQLFDAIKTAFELSDTGNITFGNYVEPISRDKFSDIIASKISGDGRYDRLDFNDAIYAQQTLTDEEAAFFAEYRTALKNWRGNGPSKKVAAIYAKIQENDRLRSFFRAELEYLTVEGIVERLAARNAGYCWWGRVVESAC